MIDIKRKYKLFRVIAAFLAVNLLFQTFFATVSLALTSGPSQPEIQSFEPISTTEMVDLFSGDFTYNIPLFELPGPNGGYPFNLFYNSGITMDQEASWTGLGWNMNAGAIVRNMRGLPDEFNGGANGAYLKHENDIRPNVTTGVSFGMGIELFGGDGGAGLGLSMGTSIYYNNYKGVGYSLEPGVSLSYASSKSGLTAGVGLNMKLDSQEGVGADASLSLKDKGEESTTTYNVGVGYNSKQGLSKVSMGMSIANNEKTLKSTSSDRKTAMRQQRQARGGQSVGGSSNLSFFSGGYSPQVSLPMQGRNISLNFKIGASFEGFYADGYASGFYNTQYIKDKGQIWSPAFGYLHLQEGRQQTDALMDFNREKDGMIRKSSPNLAIPVTTPDIYSVNGQGIAGMFRAFRNDVGTLADPEETSNTAGGSLGLDIGLGYGPQVGLDLTVNYAISESTRWNLLDGNDTQFNYGGPPNAGPLYESVYFKTYGEHTSHDINQTQFMWGESPVRVKLDPNENPIARTFTATNNLARGNSSISYTPPSNTQREGRNVGIQYIDNDQAKGMSSINADGTRYVYGQVVMNKSQVECSFTAGPGLTCEPKFDFNTVGGKPDYKFKNTDQYYNRTELTPFAYTYLLTQVLGADYIDITGDGPSDDDFGYWVKFNYNSIGADFKWRVPFGGANFLQGMNTTFEDDKGSYMYGTKEVYYLTDVQTKTHKAVFTTSDRLDGRGAGMELQNSNTAGRYGSSVKKLDNIKLFAKSNLTVPIKTVYFQYNYKLCKFVENNDNSVLTDPNGTGGPIANAKGKLTLEKVWFTYQNSGRFSPYVFDYHENAPTAENPDYNSHQYDRWGNYKPVSDYCKAINHPYVDQFNQSNPTDPLFKDNSNTNMAVWNLKQITLPSGGIINVDYEADDYAYVQNKRAMQMFQIESLQDAGAPASDVIDHERWAAGDKRRIYFKLETPTAVDTDIDQYVEGIDKVYFKVFMYVRKSSDDRTDYLSGYADIEGKGMDANSKNANNEFTRGWIQLGRPRIGMKNGSTKSLPYHPFSVAAYQYIRTNQPQLSGLGPFETDPNANESAAMDKVKSLVSVIPEMIQIFQGFNAYAHDHEWGKKLVLDKSFIRLNSPDQKKIGGGVRVKQITLSDQWDVATGMAELPNVYGQVYDYTMEEVVGKPISSGVAAYEPMIGGDEIPLRNAKEYPEVIPLKANNNLYFELPVNESYYPGAGVGYRKVTVKSLATYYEKIDNNNNLLGNQNAYDIPAGIKTTGAVVHEFYTAKEFPVITDEVSIDIQPFDLFIPIPLIGQITVNNLTASQGYSIALNDMHGKARKISNYKQDVDGNVLYGTPVNSVEYFYKSKLVKVDSKAYHDYFVLDNNVDVLQNTNGILTKNQKIMGQDFEFFVDMRKMRVNAETGGVKLNVDLIILGVFPLPAIVPWPNIGSNTNEVRTVVTNKIIHKFGILTATETFNEGSKVRTENSVFDDLTGEAVLVKVTNDFEDPIYQYSIPAYKKYDGMGGAYQNTGLTFTGTLSNYDPANKTYLVAAPTVATLLVPGDEFIISGPGGPYRAAFVKKDNTNLLFALLPQPNVTLPTNLSGDYGFSLTRSGRRNILSAKAGTLTTLGDKTSSTLGNPLP